MAEVEGVRKRGVDKTGGGGAEGDEGVGGGTLLSSMASAALTGCGEGAGGDAELWRDDGSRSSAWAPFTSSITSIRSTWSTTSISSTASSSAIFSLWSSGSDERLPELKVAPGEVGSSRRGDVSESWSSSGWTSLWGSGELMLKVGEGGHSVSHGRSSSGGVVLPCG